MPQTSLWHRQCNQAKMPVLCLECEADPFQSLFTHAGLSKIIPKTYAAILKTIVLNI